MQAIWPAPADGSSGQQLIYLRRAGGVYTRPLGVKDGWCLGRYPPPRVKRSPWLRLPFAICSLLRYGIQSNIAYYVIYWHLAPPPRPRPGSACHRPQPMSQSDSPSALCSYPSIRILFSISRPSRAAARCNGRLAGRVPRTGPSTCRSRRGRTDQLCTPRQPSISS